MISAAPALVLRSVLVALTKVRRVRRGDSVSCPRWMTGWPPPIMTMRPIINAARFSKRLFVALRLHRVLEPFNPLLTRISFMSVQAKWCAEHPAVYTVGADPATNRITRTDLYQQVLKSERLDGEIDFWEFGVGQGHSFRWWVEHNRHPGSRFVGFDTFSGLPDAYGIFKEGSFSTGGEVPHFQDQRCSFEVGLFQDTLPRFIDDYVPLRRKVVHLDADLYSSTLFVLTTLSRTLRKGDILVFDEFGVPTHEFRAFTDFAAAYRVEYQVLAAINNYLQVALRVERDMQ